MKSLLYVQYSKPPTSIHILEKRKPKIEKLEDLSMVARLLIVWVKTSTKATCTQSPYNSPTPHPSLRTQISRNKKSQSALQLASPLTDNLVLLMDSPSYKVVVMTRIFLILKPHSFSKIKEKYWNTKQQQGLDTKF